MLTHLSIQNYALITELDIRFDKGFSVLTGETGAGKSIILGALALLMGGRADARAITEGEQKCVIEGEFDLTGYGLEALFEEEGLDYTPLCTIRRELTASGKSRSFVNDTPVTLQVLKPLASRLIDIHSQHQNLLLSNASFCLEIVDSLANNRAEREAYAAAYTAYRQLQRELSQLQEEAGKAAEEAEFTRFRYNKLVSAVLREGELDELEELRQRLAHAEDIRQGLSLACSAMENDESHAAISLTREAHAALQHIASYLPTDEQLPERLESVSIELRDICSTMERLLENLDADPMRLEATEDRISELHTLFRQFGVDSEEQLIAERDRLGAMVDRQGNYTEEIFRLTKALLTAEQKLQKASAALTASRQGVRATLEQSLADTLSRLGIAHAAVQLELSPLSDYSESGHDEAVLLFAANKNQQLRPVSDIASGGEMARLMLSIKALIADTAGLPTVIFDEVDTGVSGEVAVEMGHLMRDMAQGRQILAITHLPQIAAMGEHHYRVYKQDTEHRTETHIRPLTADERVSEIAQLLSGSSISPEALSNAKRLLTEGE